MKKPILSRILHLKLPPRVGPTRRRRGPPRRVNAVDLLHVPHGVGLGDCRLRGGRGGRGTDGGEFEPGDGFAAVLAVVRGGRGGGRVDLLGEGDSQILVDDFGAAASAREGEVGVQVEGRGGVAVCEVVVAGFEGGEGVDGGGGLVGGVDEFLEEGVECFGAGGLH